MSLGSSQRMSTESACELARPGGFVKKLLILAGAALLFTACAESPTSPTTGRRIAPSGANHDDEFKCASGYIVAYDEYGNPYCVPEGDQSRMAGSVGSVGTADGRSATPTTSGRP
jgi:hypothetical protein